MTKPFSYEEAIAPAEKSTTFSFEAATGKPEKDASLGERVGFGFKRALSATQTALTDDPTKIAKQVAETAADAPRQSAAAAKMQADIKPYVEAANKAEGVVDTVKGYGILAAKRAGQLISNPGEAGKMIAEQLPNSLPGMAGGIAGAKGGAALGSVFGPLGTAAGAVIGGVAGGLAGGYLTEKGSSIQEQVQKKAQEQGVNVQDQQALANVVKANQKEIDDAAALKGLGTAGTDAVLNVLTVGLSGMGRRMLGNEIGALAGAVKAGQVTAADAAKSLAALEAKAVAQGSWKNVLGRGAAVTTAEMLGEGASEAVGQKLAYGSVDAGEVVDESLLGLGQGVGMAAASGAYNKLAGTPDIDQNRQRIDALRGTLADPAANPVVDQLTQTVAPLGVVPDPAAPLNPLLPKLENWTDLNLQLTLEHQLKKGANVNTPLVQGLANEIARRALSPETVKPADPIPLTGDVPTAPPAQAINPADLPDAGTPMPTTPPLPPAQSDPPVPTIPPSPPKPSEVMGLDPAIGSLTAAAAIAVDGPAAATVADAAEAQAAQEAATKTKKGDANVSNADAPGAVAAGTGGPVGVDATGGRPDAGLLDAATGQRADGAAGASAPSVSESVAAPVPGQQLNPALTKGPTQTKAKVGSLKEFMARKKAEREAANVQDQPQGTAAAAPAQAKPETQQAAPTVGGDGVAQSGAAPAGNAGVEAVGVAPASTDATGKQSSWVIREKATGTVVMETFDRAKVEALNTAKYEAVPVQEHLASLNKKPAPQPTTTEPTNGIASDQTLEGRQEQPQAPAGAAAAEVADEIVSVKTVYGDTVRVRKSDLDSDRPRLPTFTAEGKRKIGVMALRDNLDPTGEKQAAANKEDADNPLTNVVTRKGGESFATRMAAEAERKKRGLTESHEVVGASTVSPNATGFVVKRKEAPDATQEAAPAEPALAKREDGTLKNKNEYTEDEWKAYTKSVIDAKLAAPAAEDAKPSAWSEAENGFTKRPVHRYSPDPRIHWATVQNPSNGVYVIEYRIGDKVVSTEELGDNLTAVKFHVVEKVKELDAKQASHQDPGEKPEAATKGVVKDSLKTASKNEDTTPSQMRKWLLAEIDKELLNAPDRADYDEAVKRMGEKDAISMYTGNGPLGKNSETGFITFDVPGDGKFKVRNSVRGLLEFRKNVNATQGFKDNGQKTVKPEQNDGVQGGSGGQMAAITNMIEEGDFEAARDFSEAVGIKLADVKVPRGERKPQWDQFVKDGTLPPEPASPKLEFPVPLSVDSFLSAFPSYRSYGITAASLQQDGEVKIKSKAGAESLGTAQGSGGNGSFMRAFLSGEIRKADPEQEKPAAPQKPKDTGWNMAGTGYGGKRYTGRNITLDDGREVVARVYENAGNYDEVEIKVDGVRKFTVRDSYNAQDKADAFIKTLTADAPKAAESPTDFIPAPDGGLDYGEITPEMSKAMRRQAGKIRLQRGDSRFGLTHIEQRHGDEIRAAGFQSVEAFVADIAGSIAQVWQPGATSQLVALKMAGNDRIMYVQLQAGVDAGGDFYTVNTAFPARSGYVRNKKDWKKLWEGRAQPSQPATSEQAPFAASPQEAGEATTIPSGQSEASVAQSAAKANPPKLTAEDLANQDKALLDGVISVQDYMDATGLTDDDVGVAAGDGLRQQADREAKAADPYHQGIQKMQDALSEQMKSALDAPSSTPQQRKSKEERMARITRDRATLDMIARGFEHPFDNRFVTKLSPMLKARFTKQWESIKTGEFAKQAFQEASYKLWAQKVIDKAREKLGMESAPTAPASEPAKPKTLKQGITKARAKKTAEAEAQRADYFTPGNILRGYGALRGRLMNYTDDQGNIRQGILMPADKDMDDIAGRFTPSLKTAQDMIDFLNKGGVLIDKDSVGATLKITMGGSRIRLETSKTGLGKKLVKEAQSVYFASSGSKMVANLYDEAEFAEFIEGPVAGLRLTMIPNAATVNLLRGDDDADGVAFSRAQALATGIPVQTAQQIVDAIAQRWDNAPQVVVLADMNDPRVPAAVRQRDAAQRSGGAKGAPEGFFYKGTAYVVAGSLKTPADVVRVLLHESLGHYGLRGVFGDALGSILNQIAALRKSEVVAKAKEYGLVPKGLPENASVAEVYAAMSESQRGQAAEEVLAVMSQTSPELGYVKRAIAAIRAWLRKHVPMLRGMALSDNDIIANYILPARAWVQRGPGGGPRGGLPAMSRGASQTASAAFKRWFGDSKVVDADGKPLVVYHGTRNDITAFDSSKVKGRFPNSEGFYFTSRPMHASVYADSIDNAVNNFDPVSPFAKTVADGANVMPAYVSLQNPKLITVSEWGTLESAVDGDGGARVRAARAAGHDGVIVTRKAGDAYDGQLVIAFRPEQIKSAIGNNGQFDPENPDIRFSRSAADLTAKAKEGVNATIKAMTATSIKQAAGYKATDLMGIALGALGRRQLVEVYGDDLPLEEYNRLAAQMEADKNETGAEADTIANEWGKLPDEAALADLMHDATLAGMDPDKALRNTDNADVYQELRDRFEALSPEAKATYRKARDSYTEHHKKVRQAIKDRIMRSNMDGARKAALVERMDAEFFSAVKGVYFPLARYGKYVVVVKNKDGMVESVNRAETMAEAAALRQSLLRGFPQAQGYDVGKVILNREFVASRDSVGRGFMQELYQALDKQNLDAAQRAELEDTLGQLYLSSLPDVSWAKHGIHRKGTPGFSQDARRAFAQNMFHGSRYLAKLRYSDLMQDELKAMQDHVDKIGNVLPEEDGFNGPRMQRVVDEFYKRHDALMNPNSHPLSTALTSIGFMFHLGLSPASAMVNLTQTALVALPVMAAKWGFTKTAAALLKASSEAAKGRNDITGSLNGDELKAYNEAVRAGVIDVTMAHDLAGIAQGEDAGVMWRIRPAMRAASFLFHHAERFNRQVTFVAAYRLAREAGAEHVAAFEQATKATYDGHFDYSAGNRPRFMQGNAAKVILLFKQYGQNMIYTLARNGYQAVNALDPAERARARKALAGVLASHAMAAGVLGLPMVTTILAAISAAGGDDDEPFDAEVALKNMLADTFGTKPAEVMAHGLSRLTPWDISGRVGLDRLILPDIQEGLEGQRLAESAMAAALGPVAGIGVNMLRGLQDIGNGHVLRGIEGMMPAALRGPLASLRLASEGAMDKTGVPIVDEVSAAGVVGQALGFSPSEVRQAQAGKRAVLSYDSALNERRQELMTQFARGAMKQDQEAMAQAREEIRAFNEKHPQRRITMPQLAQSIRSRQKRIDRADGGVSLPANRRDAMEQGRFADVE